MTWQELYQQISTPVQPAQQPAVTFPDLTGAPFTIDATAGPSVYADWRNYLTQVQQFNQQAQESQRQFNLDLYANLMRDQENIRQFDTNLAETQRRFDWESAYIPRRDAFSIAGAAFLPNVRYLTR